MQEKGDEVLVVRMEPARKRRDDPKSWALMGYTLIIFRWLSFANTEFSPYRQIT